MNYRFGRTLAGPLFGLLIVKVPPFVFALCRPGPGRLICLVFGPVVCAMKAFGISSFPQSGEATFTLSGSTCLVLLPLTARAVEGLRMILAVVSILTAMLARLLALLLTLPLLHKLG